MKVVILAGGFGTRLSEYTELIPKPMVNIGNKPILLHIIDWYKTFNFNDFVIATGYKSEVINNFLENELKSKDQEFNFTSGMQSPLSQLKKDLIIKTVYSGLKAMSGGRLLAIEKYIDGDNFMVTYGDGLSDINIDNLLKFHRSHNKVATITAVRPRARFGIMQLDDEKVISFKEKQQTNSGWINGGYFVFKKSIFKYLKDEKTVLEKEPLEKLALEGELMAFKHKGFWQCMDNKRDKDYLQKLWDSGSYPWMS